MLAYQPPQHGVIRRPVHPPAPPRKIPWVELMFYCFLGYVLFLAADRFSDVASYRKPSAVIFVFHTMFLYLHEGGHFLFSLFGRTLYILGGSFWQVMFPLLSFLIAIRDRSHIGAFSLFLTGFSMMDVSVYIGDAPARVLPLLGNDRSRHDWHNLMLDWNCLDSAQVAGDIVYYAGFVAAFAGIIAGLYFSYVAWRDSSQLTVIEEAEEEKRIEQFIAKHDRLHTPPRTPHR